MLTYTKNYSNYLRSIGIYYDTTDGEHRPESFKLSPRPQSRIWLSPRPLQKFSELKEELIKPQRQKHGNETHGTCNEWSRPIIDPPLTSPTGANHVSGHWII
ncbi:hypothetical protein OCU04_003700 [Sclerotinia nivalis]|uniref:Uncharacterized protein n=1 Tax=Sclerotinia nivalis TaxID=352851 RepID=A0A9X0ASJ5_9HELO|nr:hypothetical protein OCU04_003700 [Sclerotinia nivalis]